MKIGLILHWSLPFDDCKRSSGLINSSERIRQKFLKECDWHINKITLIEPNKSNTAKLPSTCDQSFIPLIFDNNLHKHLNKNYDFLIFHSSGSLDDTDEKGKRYAHLLSNLNIPYAVQIEHENECKNKFAKLFYENKRCKLVLPIAKGLWARCKRESNLDKNKLFCKNFIFSLHEEYIDKKKVNKYMENKEDLIITSCRITSLKRILELVKLSKKIGKLGFKIEINGTESNFFYIKSLLENQNKYWKWNGGFKNKDIEKIYSPARFHYGIAYYKNKNVFHPRLEIATIEALNYGCLPILCLESSPPWVINNNVGILVSKDDYEEDLLNEFKRLSTLRKSIAYKGKIKDEVFHFIDIFNTIDKGRTKLLVDKIKKIVGK